VAGNPPASGEDEDDDNDDGEKDENDTDKDEDGEDADEDDDGDGDKAEDDTGEGRPTPPPPNPNTRVENEINKLCDALTDRLTKLAIDGDLNVCRKAMTTLISTLAVLLEVTVVSKR
jgi:TATA-binding protein-associated factor Taf7